MFCTYRLMNKLVRVLQNQKIGCFLKFDLYKKGQLHHIQCVTVNSLVFKGRFYCARPSSVLLYQLHVLHISASMKKVSSHELWSYRVKKPGKKSGVQVQRLWVWIQLRDHQTCLQVGVLLFRLVLCFGVFFFGWNCVQKLCECFWFSLHELLCCRNAATQHFLE